MRHHSSIVNTVLVRERVCMCVATRGRLIVESVVSVPVVKALFRQCVRFRLHGVICIPPNLISLFGLSSLCTVTINKLLMILHLRLHVLHLAAFLIQSSLQHCFETSINKYILRWDIFQYNRKAVFKASECVKINLYYILHLNKVQ